MKKLSLLMVAAFMFLAGCMQTAPAVEENVDLGRGDPNPSIKEEIKNRNRPADNANNADDADMEVGVDVDADMEVGVDAPIVVVNVAGFSFGYDVDTIEVNEGDTVTINFTSTEGFHDWVVDEFDAATDKVSELDGMTSVTFVADKAGTYEFYCSVGQHRANGMVGTLIVN